MPDDAPAQVRRFVNFEAMRARGVVDDPERQVAGEAASNHLVECGVQARIRIQTGAHEQEWRLLREFVRRPADAGIGEPKLFRRVGNSFPSGHAVHVWSLFFPLLVFFPRYGLRLAVVPTLVSVARVAMNDHYLSDVLASASLAALVTSAYAIVILRPGPKHVSNR